MTFSNTHHPSNSSRAAKLLRPWLYVAFCMILSAAFTPVQAQLFGASTNKLLPEEQAFGVIANVLDGRIVVNWSIAHDYYMYRDQFRIQSSDPSVSIGEITFPEGKIEDDPEFGKVEVYFFNVELSAPISGSQAKTEITLLGQGCNKPVGICYPPQTRVLTVELDAAALSAPTSKPNVAAPASQISPDEPTSNRADVEQNNKTFWGYVLTALGAGILLSFTPCVLPMIPILAGVIAGQQNPSKLRSGWLALCYVLGTIVTYAVAGWVAGAAGTQLQAHFQNPWVIGFICSLLLVLAASLFGWFKIQLPSSLQSKLTGTQSQSRSASISSFILGLISALVVGTCVSPILIVTLGAAITQGDPVLGAAIMAAMAAGMGLLLILFGFGAGWILPKTGAWMESIQVLFGFMVLGVAIFLLGIFPQVPVLYLWSALLLCTGFYLWQLASDANSNLSISVLRALGVGAILWGAMALFGGVSGGNDILKPLDSLTLNSGGGLSNNVANKSINFQSTTTLAGAQQLLATAKNQGKPVLVDFYADWCLDCKRMHKTTFKKSSVINALESWSVVEIDVTETSKNSEEVKRFFNVFGPPATLFFKPSGDELVDLRQYGYLSENDFLTILGRSGN